MPRPETKKWRARGFGETLHKRGKVQMEALGQENCDGVRNTQRTSLSSRSFRFLVEAAFLSLTELRPEDDIQGTRHVFNRCVASSFYVTWRRLPQSASGRGGALRLFEGSACDRLRATSHHERASIRQCRTAHSSQETSDVQLQGHSSCAGP